MVGKVLFFILTRAVSTDDHASMFTPKIGNAVVSDMMIPVLFKAGVPASIALDQTFSVAPQCIRMSKRFSLPTR
jgi:hypothetical protein